MSILFLGHSLVARRQWSFMSALETVMGEEVYYCPPGRWDKLTFNGSGKSIVPAEKEMVNLDHGLWAYYYSREFLESAIDRTQPRWIGGFMEPCSVAAHMVLDVAEKRGIKTFFFSYENIKNNYIYYPPSVKELFGNVKRADVIFCGNWTASEIMKVLGAKATKLTPHCGIETEFFKPVENKFPAHRGIFLARDVPEKGWDYVDKFINKMADAEVYRPGYFIPEEAVPEFYSSGMLFVHASLRTSRWVEQFGYTIAEAMACGLPVMMSQYGSQTVWFRNAPGVVAYNPLDMASTRMAYFKAISHYPNSAGREWVLKNFSNEVVAVNYKGVFE